MKQTEAFRILASADRQLVLHELVERGGEATVEELSQQVAARRHKLSLEKVSDQQVKSAQIRLVHTHFPRLIERNIISLDWSTRTVSLTEEDCVESLFEAAEQLDTWPPNDLLRRSSH